MPTPPRPPPELTSVANEKYGDKPRNPLGTGRIFAGGGDGTSLWDDL